MSTITREFTKEQLQQIIETDHVQCGEASALARIALASLEAEPAIHRWRRVTVEPYGPYPWHYGNFIGFSKPVEGIEDEYFYSAPPAPSVDEDLLHMAASAIDDLLSNKDRSGAGVWVDIPAKLRRAAMLQGADGNSPVIPDGWVLVPVELTGAMTNAMTDAILDDLHNVDVWRSVLAAAPQQEVK